QPYAANRSPAHILDMPVVYFCLRRDHHLATGKLAVIEGEKKRAPLVESLLSIRTQRKRPPVQARQASEYCHNIAKLSVSPEPSCPHGCDVGREPNTQKIDVMDRPLFVLQPQNVACLSASSDDRLHSMFDPAIAEVTQERISGTQRQKC